MGDYEDICLPGRSGVTRQLPHAHCSVTKSGLPLSLVAVRGMQSNEYQGEAVTSVVNTSSINLLSCSTITRSLLPSELPTLKTTDTADIKRPAGQGQGKAVEMVQRLFSSVVIRGGKVGLSRAT